MRLESGLDGFILADGLPVVPEESVPKLQKFLLKQLNSAGKIKEDGFIMPLDEETGKTEGYAPFVSCVKTVDLT